MALGYVRPARDTDVDDIARVQLATWQVAYPRFIPRFAIDAVRLDWLVERWTEAVTAPPTSRHRVLVAIEQSGADATSDADPDPEGDTPPGVEHLVGFAAIGPADEAAAAPGESALGDDVAAITDLLVEPRWGRRGHGSRLLAATIDHWRDDGFRQAVAWVFTEDVATTRFLSSAGWEPDGASRALDIDGVRVPQIRMHVGFA
mgnify:CR=1 FL=1